MLDPFNDVDLTIARAQPEDAAAIAEPGQLPRVDVDLRLVVERQLVMPERRVKLARPDRRCLLDG